MSRRCFIRNRSLRSPVHCRCRELHDDGSLDPHQTKKTVMAGRPTNRRETRLMSATRSDLAAYRPPINSEVDGWSAYAKELRRICESVDPPKPLAKADRDTSASLRLPGHDELRERWI